MDSVAANSNLARAAGLRAVNHSGTFAGSIPGDGAWNRSTGQNHQKRLVKKRWTIPEDRDHKWGHKHMPWRCRMQFLCPVSLCLRSSVCMLLAM